MTLLFWRDLASFLMTKASACTSLKRAQNAPPPAGEGGPLEAPPEAKNFAQFGFISHQKRLNVHLFSLKAGDLFLSTMSVGRIFEVRVIPCSHRAGIYTVMKHDFIILA